MDENDITIIELTEENIESMIYEIRDQRVMLDFDLARIYGYKTKAFNQQVKRNIDKFPCDFMFKISRQELDNLVKCKIFTSLDVGLFRGKNGGVRKLPNAFTEQGIYMLMTILKGDLAVKQSKALIRLFKRMKDYLVETNSLPINNISLINDKFASYDKRFEVVESKLDIVMNNFIDPSKYKHFLILNGERIEADVAYQSIYQSAKESIVIIDDYIGVKTLSLLKCCSSNINIIIISDNKSKDGLTTEYINDFIKDTSINVITKSSNNRFHDRYIVVDFKSDNECLYHCGTSSKDAGNRITTIVKIEEKALYRSLLESALNG